MGHFWKWCALFPSHSFGRDSVKCPYLTAREMWSSVCPGGKVWILVITRQYCHTVPEINFSLGNPHASPIPVLSLLTQYSSCLNITRLISPLPVGPLVMHITGPFSVLSPSDDLLSLNPSNLVRLTTPLSFHGDFSMIGLPFDLFSVSVLATQRAVTPWLCVWINLFHPTSKTSNSEIPLFDNNSLSSYLTPSSQTLPGLCLHQNLQAPGVSL